MTNTNNPTFTINVSASGTSDNTNNDGDTLSNINTITNSATNSGKRRKRSSGLIVKSPFRDTRTTLHMTRTMTQEEYWKQNLDQQMF